MKAGADGELKKIQREWSQRATVCLSSIQSAKRVSLTPQDSNLAAAMRISHIGLTVDEISRAKGTTLVFSVRQLWLFRQLVVEEGVFGSETLKPLARRMLRQIRVLRNVCANPLRRNASDDC